MTREQYLVYRRHNSVEILYEYYKERFDSKRHHPFLNKADFVSLIRLWVGLQRAYKKVVEHYDNLFTIVTLTAADGTVIRQL